MTGHGPSYAVSDRMSTSIQSLLMVLHAASFRGEAVKSRRIPEKDLEYTLEARPQRSAYDGREGIVHSHSSGHGLCFRVLYDDGGEAFWEPDELFIDSNEMIVRFVVES